MPLATTLRQDDFRYFRGDAYTNADGILQRYKTLTEQKITPPVAGRELCTVKHANSG